MRAERCQVMSRETYQGQTTEKAGEDQVAWDRLVPVGRLERGFVNFMSYCGLNVGFQPSPEQVSVSQW